MYRRRNEQLVEAKTSYFTKRLKRVKTTNITGTIIKFIANYINECKAYTTYRNHTSSTRQFKAGVPQGGIFSPTLFNTHTADIPPQSGGDTGVKAHTPKSKNPCIQNYTTVRKDRPHGQSGRLLIFSIDPRISTYSWWNCQATQNRLQIEINYYPDNLLFISVGFLPRVSSQHNTYISQLILPMTTKSL